MQVTLTRVTQNPVDAIEEAASNCYDSSTTGGKIMKSCYKSGHHSVLEFADFTFHITGVSRALSHQLVRHRIASYAQRSQRYCSEDGFKYVIPNTVKANSHAQNVYMSFMDDCQRTYEALQTLGVPNEDARYVLPNACETVLEVKMNGRTLIHFMNERLCARAQWEIRKLAQKMREVVAAHDEQCAMFAEFLVPKCEAQGKNMSFCTEHSSCGRSPLLKDIMKAYYRHMNLLSKADFDSELD